jgi:hypothetical protein
VYWYECIPLRHTILASDVGGRFQQVKVSSPLHAKRLIGFGVFIAAVAVSFLAGGIAEL